LNYIDRFFIHPQTTNFMKIRPVGAELFHVERRTDERTDMMKLIVPFRNFAKAPKNETLYKNSSKCTPVT